MKKIRNFLIALIQHIKHGMKKSSDFEIAKRYSECYACSSVSPDKTQCLECGCRISQNQEFFNKLAWKDQKCPLNKW